MECVEGNLITRVCTFYNVKLTQSTNLRASSRGALAACNYVSGISISASKESMRNADWRRQMALVMMSLPLALAFTFFFNVFYIRSRFRFALIGRNLTAQSTGSHGELEVEFKFQRRSCKLSFLFPPRRQSSLESLLAG